MDSACLESDREAEGRHRGLICGIAKLCSAVSESLDGLERQVPSTEDEVGLVDLMSGGLKVVPLEDADSSMATHRGPSPSLRPMVSVLMAAHNALQYLPEAVESILKQTVEDFEFIIVDDGSSDGTGEWILRKAQTDSRIRVLRQANAGLARALNKGLSVAKGKYIARMDADDVSLPERLSAQLEAMESDPSLVIVGAAVEMMTADGWAYHTNTQPEAHDEIRAALLRGNGQALIHPVVMIRKDAMLAIGGYDDRFSSGAGEDLDLFLRLTEHGRAANLRSILLRYRQHSKSNNARYNHLWRETTRMAVLSALERVGPRVFVDEMFPKPFGLKPASSLELAELAEWSGRFRAANHFALDAFRTRGSRLAAARTLGGLWLRRAARFLPRR